MKQGKWNLFYTFNCTYTHSLFNYEGVLWKLKVKSMRKVAKIHKNPRNYLRSRWALKGATSENIITLALFEVHNSIIYQNVCFFKFYKTMSIKNNKICLNCFQFLKSYFYYQIWYNLLKIIQRLIWELCVRQVKNISTLTLIDGQNSIIYQNVCYFLL